MATSTSSSPDSRKPARSSTSPAPAQPGTRKRPDKRKKRGGVNPWVPNQHGAWAMLFVPPLIGIICAALAGSLRGFALVLVTVVAWVVGYFAFFAFELWSKARSPRRKAEYRVPLLVYGSITLAAALVVIAFRPGVLWWSLGFLPLLAIAGHEVWKRHPRSLASGVSTTCLSSLLFPVTLTVADPGGVTEALKTQPVIVWVLTAILAAYFSSTIFYVKTMIRERGNARFLVISIAFHVIFALAALIATALTWGESSGLARLGMVIVTVVTVVSAAKSVLVPAAAKRPGVTLTPKHIGRIEIPLTLAIAVGVVLAASA